GGLATERGDGIRRQVGRTVVTAVTARPGVATPAGNLLAARLTARPVTASACCPVGGAPVLPGCASREITSRPRDAIGALRAAVAAGAYGSGHRQAEADGKNNGRSAADDP